MRRLTILLVTVLLAPGLAAAIGHAYPVDPPVLQSASSLHQFGTYSVEARGVGLSVADSAQLAAPDGTWRLALRIMGRSDTTLTASATVAALMPASVLELLEHGHVVATAPLEPDPPVPPINTTPVNYFLDPASYIRPKDFALFYDGLGHFHLFYTRHNGGLLCSQYEQNEKSFGHAQSIDLVHWSEPDSSSFTTAQSAGPWDAAHVWAPTLVQRGPVYYLIYTGVDADGNQSIGCATTLDINTAHIDWQRQSAPLFTLNDVKWGFHDPPDQLRDPFVMENPFLPGQFLMQYAAVKGRGANFDTMSVGVASCEPGNLEAWSDNHPIYITDFTHTYRWKTESPHAFLHVNQGNNPPDSTWYLFFTSESSPASIRMLTNPHSPVDPSEIANSNHWATVTSLYEYLGNDSRVADWNATEYLRAGTQEYLAGYIAHTLSDCTTGIAALSRIWMVRLEWAQGAPGTADRFSIAAPVAAVEGGGTPAPGPELSVLGFSRRSVRFRVGLPAALPASLEIFDVAGRRLRTLVRGEWPAGSTEMTWDGTDAAGKPAPSGTYLLRLTCPAGSRTARATLLR